MKKVNDIISHLVDTVILPIYSVRQKKTFQSFLLSCIRHSGQPVNETKLGESVGVSGNTAKKWLEILEKAGIILKIPAREGDFKEGRKKERQIITSDVMYVADQELLAAAQYKGLGDCKNIQDAVFRSKVVVDLTMKMKVWPFKITHWCGKTEKVPAQPTKMPKNKSDSKRNELVSAHRHQVLDAGKYREIQKKIDLIIPTLKHVFCIKVISQQFPTIEDLQKLHEEVRYIVASTKNVSVILVSRSNLPFHWKYPTAISYLNITELAQYVTATLKNELWLFLPKKARDKIKKGKEIGVTEKQSFAEEALQKLEKFNLINVDLIRDLLLEYLNSKEVHGAQEWGESLNFQDGCSNNCRYCYAKAMAARFERIPPERWKDENIRKPAVDTLLKKNTTFDSHLMIPSSHDISEENVDIFINIAKELLPRLSEGYNMIIVTKPRLSCIMKMCNELEGLRDKILFRFTIGSADQEVLTFWEADAPDFSERIECLKLAYNKGYKTSVSSEPMLDARIDLLVPLLLPYVTDSIWLGKANKLSAILGSNKVKNIFTVKRMEQLEAWLNKDAIFMLFLQYNKHLKIKWKDSIKKIVGLDRPQEIGLDI